MNTNSMNTKINWQSLIDQGPRNMIKDWAGGQVSTKLVIEVLTGTTKAGEFRKLVRTHGTTYSRRLARKALRRRGISV